MTEERMSQQRFNEWADTIGLTPEQRGPVLYVIDREASRERERIVTVLRASADEHAVCEPDEWHAAADFIEGAFGGQSWRTGGA